MYQEIYIQIFVITNFHMIKGTNTDVQAMVQKVISTKI